MASLIQYDSLNAMPAPPAEPTAAQLQTAKVQYDRAEVGDGQPLPPPFTYGKIWVPPYNRGPVEKVPKAPSMSATELKQLMKDLPKPETQLQLPAPPIGGIPVPGRPDDPTTFLQLARASINQRRYAKIWRRIGKRLNVRGITRATNQRPRRNQDNYNLLIELSTNVTGKHTIFYSTRMTQQTGTVGPVTQNQAQQEELGLQANFDFPQIPRTDKTPPYSQPRDKKNEKWMDLSNKLEEWLKQHFHKGNELAMPNPLYPKQTKFDKIFRISDFQWKYLPKNLDNLTGKNPPFKYYITNNRTNRQDPNMYIVLKVKLVGRFRKGNKVNPKRVLPVGKVKGKKKGNLKKAASFCGNQLSDLKTIALDKYHSTPGLFIDSQSEKFEKRMKKATAANIVSKNIKLYYENRKKALDYWEQEYYCRQAQNFNAGVNGGWPNIAPASSRYPFDPWTLQPAVALTSKSVTYPNGLPGQAPNGGSNAAIPGAANAAPMRAWYAAQPAGFQRPAWPLPFSPFGMSLKPKMVLILFKRMNNYLNTPGGGRGVGAPPAPVGAAIVVLQPLRVQGKLPDLTTVPLTPAQWTALFTLYEYVLYNRFEANEPELVLEPYEPYPRLPAPPAGGQIGIWLISRNRWQYAIPVNTGVAPWGPAGAPAPALPGIIPGVGPRNRVSWRQVKANGFYKIEAKKWAEWMVLSNPFPIPGFPIYSSYTALFQKYKYYKLHRASIIPQPNNALVAGQEVTNCSMPPVDVIFNSSFREGGQWTLPSQANRTAQYINPYSAVALPAGAPGGWRLAGFLNLINAPASIGKWLYGGPSPGKYPKEVWPKNNMRVHGAIPPTIYPPLEDVIKINVRRSKRKNLGGWQGGRRKKTLKRRKKKRKNKTLKRKSKRKR